MESSDDAAADQETANDAIASVANSLERMVEETLLNDGDEQPALRFVESLLNSLEGAENGGAAVPLVFACLMRWLVGAREHGINSAAAVTWVNDRLEEDAAAAALRASGLLGYPYAPDLTVSELHDQLGPVAIAAMIWLAAGAVATAGDGDPQWIRQFDPSS